EEGLHPEIVRLAPAVERVVMALGAGDAHAEQDLGKRACPLAWLGRDLVERRRSVLLEWPVRGQQFASELVKGFVACGAFVDPTVKTVRSLVSQRLSIDAEN